jgi:hypothetical protein
VPAYVHRYVIYTLKCMLRELMPVQVGNLDSLKFTNSQFDAFSSLKRVSSEFVIDFNRLANILFFYFTLMFTT